jgi:hypothetical protein
MSHHYSGPDFGFLQPRPISDTSRPSFPSFRFANIRLSFSQVVDPQGP